MRSRQAALLLACAFLFGCNLISFRKTPSSDEIRLKSEVQDFYGKLKTSFAVANPDSLATLFWPSITQPMSHAQIKSWAEDFFKNHPRPRFVIETFEITELGYSRAVVQLRYKIVVPEAQGSFGAFEEDELKRDHGRWFIASWRKLP
jgi:hypothetical protein